MPLSSFIQPNAPAVRCRTAGLRRPFFLGHALALLVLAGAPRADAGATVRPPQSRASAAKTPLPAATPAPTPLRELSGLPYLVAIGPTKLLVKPIAGPRVRQPPMLPVLPPALADPDAVLKPTPPVMPGPREPSAFSPDAAPTLLPAEPPPTTPAPAKPAEPTESALVPALRGEQELRDSVIYFETPVGNQGAQITVPAVAPLVSPATAPQPPSRATYRKDKE